MSSCCGLRSGSSIMETELTSSSRGRGFGSIFGSTVKPRPARFQTSGSCSVSDINIDFHLLHILLICRLVHALLTFFLMARFISYVFSFFHLVYKL